ncbi:MAG: hypothetical protein LC751_05925 [Actinobacteria bacterium]|nr:hypothetical protein [Actinomycetota bacterium]
MASSIRFRADQPVVLVVGKGAENAAVRLAPNRTVALDASARWVALRQLTPN